MLLVLPHACSFIISLPVIKGARKRGNIVAETLFPEMFPSNAKTRKHLLRKENVSEQIQKHLCFRNKCFLERAANEEACASTTMFPQDRFLV